MKIKYLIQIITIKLILFLTTGCSLVNNNEWEFKSPDNNIRVKLLLDENSGELFYKIRQGNSDIDIIEKSRLGFELGNKNFMSGLKFKSDTYSLNQIESYTLLSGKNNKVNENYNEYQVSFSNKDEVDFILSFRLFNNGVGFRYNLNTDLGQQILSVEKTTFNLPTNGKGWLQYYDLASKWTPGYEKPYTNGSQIGENAPDSSNGWCFPMLFEVNNKWILISEAGLDNNNSAMHIAKDCNDGEYKIEFPAEEEAFGMCESRPTIATPWISTWRVIMIGDELKDIFESNLITSLSEPTKAENLDWIEPGRAAWSWWSDSDSPQDFNKQKEYVDFASSMGWEYSLVDANWNNMKGGNIEQLANYAFEKNVGLLLWYNSGGENNIVEEEPRNKMSDTEIRRKEFSWMRNIGVKGIKVDFFQSDKKCVIEQYHGILTDALKYNLVVNFHGCTMPRGWERTYPNLLSMEAVRGGETYKFGKTFPDEAVLMSSIYPFTRNVVGAMDYTPVMFTNHTYPHKTTYANELATSIVFESGIIHFADSKKMYESQPRFVLEFLQNIEAAWDESKLLSGYPGIDIGIARRKNDKWFIAGINSEESNKSVKLNFDFLDNNKYLAKIIADGDDSKSFEYTEKTIRFNDELVIDLLPFGGYSIFLVKK